jgi:hypothetical protein
MTKKIQIIAAVITLILYSLAFSQVTPHVYMELNTDEVSETDTVSLEIGVSAGDSIKSVLMRLNYDEQKFTFINGTPARLFQMPTFWDIHLENILGDSMVYLVGVTLVADTFITAPGPFFKLNFAAIDSGEAVFKLDSLNFIKPDLTFMAGTSDSLVMIIASADTFPPDPVTDFKAQEDGSGRLKLTWRNPNDVDYEGTIILRSTEDFILVPDTTETVIYNGILSDFTDEDLVDDKMYYYTAFTYDEIPNYSTPVFLKGEPKDEYVFAYPNPFNPDEGMRFNILFSNNTFIDIKIYDAVGNHVINLYKDEQIYANIPSTDMEWNGRNGDGDVVANGVYYFVVKTSQGDQKIGKLAVLR